MEKKEGKRLCRHEGRWCGGGVTSLVSSPKQQVERPGHAGDCTNFRRKEHVIVEVPIIGPTRPRLGNSEKKGGEGGIHRMGQDTGKHDRYLYRGDKG